VSLDDGSTRRIPERDEREDGRECDPRPTFDEVVELYGPKIYRIALRLTGNLEDAADLSQDVFLRIYGSLDRYEPGTFDGWLYRVTKNLFLDRARRRGRLRTEPLPEEEWRAPASADPGPADILERRTLEATLERGLAQLTADFRLAVVLCDVEGLTYDEIADITGWPLGTVRSRIHRGRRALRDFLAVQPAPTDGAPDHARAARNGLAGRSIPPPEHRDQRDG
jgi:RNA polymerase sigma-70 factor (ECF subfamily)